MKSLGGYPLGFLTLIKNDQTYLKNKGFRGKAKRGKEFGQRSGGGLKE
jgi:hypothetical protein